MDSASVQPRANTACYVLFRLMACSNLLRVVCYPKGEEMSSQQRKESSAGSGSCGQAASAALNSRARGCKGSDGGTPKCPRGAAAGTPSVLHGSGAQHPWVPESGCRRTGSVLGRTKPSLLQHLLCPWTETRARRLNHVCLRVIWDMRFTLALSDTQLCNSA